MITDIDEIKFVSDPYNKKKAVAVQPQGDYALFNNSVSKIKEFKDVKSNSKLLKTQWWQRPRRGLKEDKYKNYESYETSIGEVHKERGERNCLKL